jgi:hypothetical protein
LLGQEKAKLEEEAEQLKGYIFLKDIEVKVLENQVAKTRALLKHKTTKVKLLEKEKDDLEELVGRQESTIDEMEALKREMMEGWAELLG